jgi:hypothetical protein
MNVKVIFKLLSITTSRLDVLCESWNTFSALISTFLFMAPQPNVGQELRSIAALRSHTQTRNHSVGLPCTIEQRYPEICT